jgi:hypothetical protein
MKTLLLTLLMLIGISTFAQTRTDSIPIKSDWYARTTPFAVFTGAGTLHNRLTQSIEFGRSFGVIDLGAAVGRVGSTSDTCFYIEPKITMNVCQYGIFSNEISFGAGKTFSKSTPLMLEASSNICIQLRNKLAVGICMGYYDLSGSQNDQYKQYFGFFMRYGSLRNESGGLVSSGVHPHINHHR